MPANEDLLYGKIALAKNYVTQAQIDECVQMQSMTDDPPPLGELLLYKGYLTPDQHAKVLEAQKQNMELAESGGGSKLRRESVLLGKLAVRERFLSQEQVNESLRIQAAEGEKRSLGEIMVERKFLTADQLKDLLSKQRKKIMSCAACRLSFTVLTLSEDKQVSCPRCKGPLTEGKAGPSVGTDAEFSTQILRAVKAGLPDAARTDSRIIPPSAKKVKVVCVICDNSFEGPLDSTGRVRCPACNTSFTPK